jgi:O6-methylguanine-DNA--protein-cysteine methyltransferase
MTESPLFTYRLIPSTIGEVGLVRRTEERSLQRIFLPRKGVSMCELIGKVFPGAVPDKGDRDAVCTQLRAFLAGTKVEFSLDDLDFAGIGGFTRRVLTADHAIPRGRVMTYGGLAARLGIPGGGLPMKRALLAMEGVAFDGRGRVVPEYII